MNTSKKIEHVSAKMKKLEEEIKAKWGQKRGRSFIAAAKQAVDYEMGSDNTQALEWIRKYEYELEKKL